jgi:hypothetical protein
LLNKTQNEHKSPAEQQAETNALIREKAWLKLAEHPYFLHVANQQQLTAVIEKLEQAMTALPQGLERDNHELSIALLRSLLNERANPQLSESSDKKGVAPGTIQAVSPETNSVLNLHSEEVIPASPATPSAIGHPATSTQPDGTPKRYDTAKSPPYKWSLKDDLATTDWKTIGKGVLGAAIILGLIYLALHWIGIL